MKLSERGQGALIAWAFVAIIGSIANMNDPFYQWNLETALLATAINFFWFFLAYLVSRPIGRAWRRFRANP